jgi:uncharacterized protein YbjT (DUF2867 family)
MLGALVLRLFLIAYAVALFSSPLAAADLRPVVVVAGASGETGVEVIRALKAKDVEIRGLVRDIDKAKTQNGDAATWVTADVRDPQSLTAAFAGATYAISVIGARESDGANNFEAVDWLGNQNLINAAKAAEVRLFVLMTSGSAGPGDVNDPRVKKFGAGRVWKGQAEDYLRASGMPYAIIAPGGLRNYAANTKGLQLRPRSQYKVGQVSRADVASVLVECLTNKDCETKTITVINTDSKKPGAWVKELAEIPIDTPKTIRLAPAKK